MWRMALYPNISKLLCSEQKKVLATKLSVFNFNSHISIKTSKDPDKSWPRMYLLKFCLRQANAILALSSKYGKWPYSFATFVANEKILLDTAELDHGAYKMGTETDSGTHRERYELSHVL